MKNTLNIIFQWQRKQMAQQKQDDVFLTSALLNPDYALVRFLSSFGMTAYTLVEWAAAKPPPISLRNKGLSFRAKRGIPLKNANADYGLNPHFPFPKTKKPQYKNTAASLFDFQILKTFLSLKSNPYLQCRLC